MAEAHSGETRWSRERWFLTISIIFAVQVVVVIWLSGRMDEPIKARSKKLQTHYVSTEMSAELAPLLQLIDPTIYALANPEGFSGAVWLNVNPVEYRSAGWSDPPQFLKFDEEQLLSDLEQFGRANQPRRSPVPANMVGDYAPRVELSKELKPSAETMFEIAGELRPDDLAGAPSLPTVEFDGVLAPSIVLLQVDQRGRVFSANLTGSSGLASADQSAMKIGRSLQFEAARGFSATTDNRDFDNLRHARFVVHWSTVPVPPTNSPPSNPLSVGPTQ